MSVVTLFSRFTKNAPTISGIKFDAVLEDTLEASVEITQYPLEVGVNAADHIRILPFRWRLTGAISNNPLRPSVTDFTGLLSNLGGGGVGATALGLDAGFLAGSDGTRASSALGFLIKLMTDRKPFDIDAGDIQLSNMVIESINRTKNPANEGGLIFEAQLQELPTLSTFVTESNAQPGQDQLLSTDPSASQAAAIVDKGEQTLGTPSAVNNTAVAEVPS